VEKRKNSTTIFLMKVYPEHFTTWGQGSVRDAALTVTAYWVTLTNEVTGLCGKTQKDVAGWATSF